MAHNAMSRSAVIVVLLVLSAAVVRAHDQTTFSDAQGSLPSPAVSLPGVRVGEIADYASSDTATSLHASVPLNTIYLPLITSMTPCNDVEQRPDDPIGNDDQVGAGQLTTIGKTCEGSLEDDVVGTTGDDDYYWLDLNVGDKVTIDLAGIPEGANYDLYFYRFEPNFFSVSSETPNQADEHIDYTSIRPARYFIRIRMKSKSIVALNTYLLRVAISFPITCNDVEDNDKPAQARPITTELTLPQDYCFGSLEDDPQGGSDYYWVDLTAGQSININLFGTSSADYDLALYDENLQLVALSAFPGSIDEYVRYVAGSAGRFYIRIYMRSKSSSAHNTYALRVSSFVCDSFEPNDDRRVNPSGPLASGQSYQAKLCSGDSEDNYYFDTTTGNQVQLRLILPSSLVRHTTIALYSIEALSLPLPGCYIDLVPSADYVLSCPIPSAGRYIVRIYTDTVGDNDNPYTLQVTYQ